MNRISWVVIGWLLLLATAQAASFDCRKASTTIEKLICSNSKLSILDDDLNNDYQYVVHNSSQDIRSTLVAAQKTWLKQTRNNCRDELCLSNVYTSRIKEVNENYDPFSDMSITCEEMRRFPEKVFQNGIDLGSGSGSPIAVDYRCPESLASLAFLKRINEIAEVIRSEGGPQECTGSIIGAHWRYYLFDLARAGFALELLDSTDNPDVLKYFEQWSWESPYNFSLHKQFFDEFGKDISILAEHYRKEFGLSEQESQIKARSALMVFVNRAAGSFSKEELQYEGRLVDLARSDSNNQDELKEALANAKDIASINEAYYALKVALYHNKSKQFISALLEYIGPINDKEMGVGDESALFAALYDHQNVQLLLDKGESVDYFNSFGKTALYYAIGFNDHDLVTILLNRGADVNHTYMSAKELNPDNNDCSPNTYLKHTKRTPLMHAAQNSDVDMLKLLIKSGAHLNDRDEIGFTVFDYAVMGNKIDNQAYLRSIGAKVGNPVFPSDATNQQLPLSTPPSSSSVPTAGYVSHLEISHQRPDILVASINPYSTLIPGEEHGLYLYSIANPGQPELTRLSQTVQFSTTQFASSNATGLT